MLIFKALALAFRDAAAQQFILVLLLLLLFLHLIHVVQY